MFGLFKSHRKVGAEAAVNAIRPLIATIQHNQGLPSSFWTNYYILGFFTFTAGHHIKLATRGSIKDAELSAAVGDALTTVSNLNGQELVQRTIQMSHNDEFDFNRDADDAAAICFYTMRILKNEAEHPLVTMASKDAQRSTDGGNTEAERRAYIASMMMLSLMNEVHSLA
ncbi:hypothetical protein A1D31_31675 [Bradyrhizobium liaoningense]|nr:hypothetical protein A1D31_31675 [Bradyrhizobium liaoningense]